MTLFARSFLLIALLAVVSAAVWLGILRATQREPIAVELSHQAVSIVNLTRAALVNADPSRRRGLLGELSDIEGIRVYPAAPAEALEPMPREPLLERVGEIVRLLLGSRTRTAWGRDGEPGFWVSFFIGEDEFWLRLPRERLEPETPWQWLGWAGLMLALSLGAAWLIANMLSRPLSALARAARRLGRGEAPEPLAESGPRELRTVAAAFNRMAQDLASMERERAMVLAGISHDLRTPLSRLRLALELSGAEAGAAEGMRADIAEMDQVIGQFLDFARGEAEPAEPCDLRDLCREIVEHYDRLGKRVTLADPPDRLEAPLARVSLRRALMNLVDNALRYAGEPVELRLSRDAGRIVVEVLDRGPGIPAGEAERLKRPFTRLDEARSGKGGAGLGLAIVERAARAHGGRFDLLAREGGGLIARLALGTR
jgi:two-component system osmolarity sensor histidine kinase EnvZ